MHRGKKEIFKYFGTKFRERKRNRDGEKAAPKLWNWKYRGRERDKADAHVRRYLF